MYEAEQRGIEIGEQRGIEAGIRNMVKIYQKFGQSWQRTVFMNLSRSEDLSKVWSEP